MIDLVCLTNALTDLVFDVTDEDLKRFGLQKGQYNGAIKPAVADYFLQQERFVVPAGSPANVAFDAKKLGVDVALLGTLGDDWYAQGYVRRAKDAGIRSALTVRDSKSGVCYVLITPDGERTTLATIGNAGAYDTANVPRSRIFHTSGYELATNPNAACEMILKAKDAGAKLSFDLASPRIVQAQQERLDDLVEMLDVLFMTEEEATALTDEAPMIALERIGKACPMVVLKQGNKGSIVQNKTHQFKIPAYPVRIVNTTGAGDAYAAGFLSGYLRGYTPRYCGELGATIASLVCGINEAHL